MEGEEDALHVFTTFTVMMNLSYLISSWFSAHTTTITHTHTITDADEYTGFFSLNFQNTSIIFLCQWDSDCEEGGKRRVNILIRGQQLAAKLSGYLKFFKFFV